MKLDSVGAGAGSPASAAGRTLEAWGARGELGLPQLRAVIDSLQRERQAQDPFLNWIAERKTTENH